MLRKNLIVPKNSVTETPKRFMSEYGRQEHNRAVDHGLLFKNVNIQDDFVIDEEPYGVNVQHRNESNKRNVLSYLVDPRCNTELDRYGNNHKLLDEPWKLLPGDKSFLRRNCNKCYAGKGDFLDHRFYDFLKPNDDIHSCRYYDPVPKRTYCIKSRRQRDSGTIQEAYKRDSFVDISVGTSVINLEGGQKPEQDPKVPEEREEQNIRTSQHLNKEMELNPVDKSDFKDKTPGPMENETELRKFERTASEIGSATASEVRKNQDDKKPEIVSPAVREIKYYEGSLNIYGIQDKEDPSTCPYFKITKTVTFEKERGEKSSGNVLGIDSWMQTDGEYNETENTDSERASSKEPQAPGPISNELQCAKVCCDCLKTLVNNKLQSGPAVGLKINENASTVMDKSTDVNKTDQSPQLTGNDLMKLIGELFLEVIPRDTYNRITGKEQHPSKDEEYEVLVKSYDRTSSESCNIKNCKMRKPEQLPQNWSKNDKTSEIKRSLDKNDDPNLTAENTKSDGDDEFYNCQITINGKKIFVKVNKSVENLLLTGNVQNISRIPSDVRTKKGRQSDQGRKNPEIEKMAGNCKCFEIKPKNNPEKIKAKKKISFTGIDAGTDQNKGGNYPGRNTKPVLTSPPPYGSDARRTNKLRNEIGNAKNLYWYNVETPDINLTPNKDKKSMRTYHFEHAGEKPSKTETNGLDRLTNKTNTRKPLKVYTKHQPQDVKKCKQALPTLEEDCLPLYWESQCMKYCHRFTSKDTEREDGYENYRSEACNRNFVHDATKRMLVTPTSNVIDNPPSLCIIKISDNEKCEKVNNGRGGYQDYTVANLASMKLNSNPFETGRITCRKCLETLRTLDSTWAEGKNCDSYQDRNQTDFYNCHWNRLPNDTVNEFENVTAKTKIDFKPQCHSARNCCFLDNYSEEQTSYPSREWNPTINTQFFDSVQSDTFPCKPYGICFNITRVKASEEVTYEYPKMQNQETSTGKYSVGTTEREIQLTRKRFSMQMEAENVEAKVDKRNSFIFSPIFKRGSKSNLKKYQSVSKMEDTAEPNIKSTASCSFEDRKNISLEAIKSADKILLNMNRIHTETGEGSSDEKTVKKSNSRNKIEIRKAWRWWRRKDNLND